MNKQRIILGIIAILIACWLSASIATYIFSGLINFFGLVLLIESIKILRRIVERCVNLVDILLYAIGAYVCLNSGITMGLGIGIAGLLFSYYYKPFIINRRVRELQQQ